MKSFCKILAEINEKRKKYFDNPLFYAKKIKSIVSKKLPGARILLFGSAVEGNLRPGSDIDILIISPDIPSDIFSLAKIKLEIKNKFSDAPFEIHLATPDEFENWYKNFVKHNFKEVV
ncbi:MAG: nucleotidyltransferase domain-containing protein [Myxococcota bacterium]